MSDTGLPGTQNQTRNPDQPTREAREVSPFMTFDNGNRTRVDLEPAKVEKVGKAPLTSDLTPPEPEEVVTNTGDQTKTEDEVETGSTTSDASGDGAKTQLPPD